MTPDGRLPDASKGAQHLRDVFFRMGFNDQEIVALSGSHTLVCRCPALVASSSTKLQGCFDFPVAMKVLAEFSHLVKVVKWRLFLGVHTYRDEPTRNAPDLKGPGLTIR